MILIQCVVPLGNICILNCIFCKEQQLLQSDESKESVLNIVTTTTWKILCQGDLHIKYNGYKPNKQNYRFYTRFFSCFYYMPQEYVTNNINMIPWFRELYLCHTDRRDIYGQTEQDVKQINVSLIPFFILEMVMMRNFAFRVACMKFKILNKCSINSFDLTLLFIH